MINLSINSQTGAWKYVEPKLDLEKHNTQYPKIEKFNLSHDRFMIIDAKTVYHFGASLKDLGKK